MNPCTHYGRTPWTGDRPIDRSPPNTGQHSTREREGTSMPGTGLEPPIAVFKLCETNRALDSATTGLDFCVIHKFRVIPLGRTAAGSAMT
jgi:hypothetical protein